MFGTCDCHQTLLFGLQQLQVLRYFCTTLLYYTVRLHNAPHLSLSAHPLINQCQVVKAGRQLDFSDLEADPIVMFQHHTDPWLAFTMCFAVPGIVPFLCWGEAFWNGVWVAGALRYVVCLHCTWLVNSAAHFFGDHPYDEKSWPAENPVVAVLSIGEGWHNW